MNLLISHLLLVFHIFVFFLLVIDSGFLVLLVLGDQIVHIRLCFCELHFVHSLSSVPMQKGLSSEHSSELLSYSLKHLLDGCGVTHESSGHFESVGRNIANGGFDVVGNPLYEIRRILVLYVEHLLVYFFSGNSSSEHSRGSQVPSVSGVRGTHHILGIEHLLSQLRHIQVLVHLRASRSEGSESDHEKVQSGERHQISGQFSQVRVQLSREPETTSDSTHTSRDQVVQVSVGRSD